MAPTGPSTRHCYKCKSEVTTTQKRTGRPVWRRHNGEYWCHRCYTRCIYRKRHGIRDDEVRRLNYGENRHSVRDRHIVRLTQWREENPTYRQQYYAIHSIAEKAYCRDHRAKYPKYHQERLRKYRKANPKRIAAHRALRRKALDRATPNWVDWPKMVHIFLNRPPGYSVDHIIPIKNHQVCGLNVPWNLQYLPYDLNSRKHNKFDGTYDNRQWYQDIPLELRGKYAPVLPVPK